MFDLEKAIAEWRRAMRRSSSIEEGDFAELERYLRDKIEDLGKQGFGPEEAFRGAEAEFQKATSLEAAYGHSRAARPGRRFPWRPAKFDPGLLASHVRIAFRRLRRQKSYSLINIGGLALGIAAGLFVLIFVREEMSYDRFHAKADRIYRVAQDIHIENRVDSALPTPPILAAGLAADFPEIESTARLAKMEGIVEGDHRRFSSVNIYAADAGFFEVFSFPLAAGNPKMALAEPNQVILTRSAARKCFGDSDPMGRILKIDGDVFTVTGLAEDCPRNSHIHFEFLTSIPTYPRSKRTGWFDGFCATYLVLRKGATPQALEAKLPDFVLNHHFGGKKGGGLFKDWVYFLQPLTSIHLGSHLLIGEFEANSSTVYVHIFLFIAVFVLLVACLNFVNLSTARSSLRGREVGIRKVFGSRQTQLIRQFLGESVLTSLGAFAVALVLVLALMPAFQNLTGKEIAVRELARPSVFLFLVLLTFIVGVCSGIYPALVLSSFRPAITLGGARAGAGSARSSSLRKGLVVLQFSISAFLLAGTVVVYQQTDYFQSKRLGFDREHVLVVRNAPLLGKRVRAFKNRLLQDPEIQSVSLSSALPGGEDLSERHLSSVRVEGSREDVVLEMLTCDQDLKAALKLEMVEGRFFSTEYPSDDRAIVINEETARGLGWPQPIGRSIRYDENEFHVIGVLGDFHFHSLHSKIPRMGFVFTGDSRESNGSYFAVRVRPADIRGVLARIREAWDSFSPPLPLSYSFLDEDYASLYAAESRTMKVLGVFSALAVVISCLGLFGLACFMTERRRREIGIRKVLGARMDGIAVMLGREFLGWVTAATLIAWPAAFYVSRRWLEKFAYRIDLGFGPFVLSAGMVLFIAGAVVLVLTIRAASANPVDSLRYE